MIPALIWVGIWGDRPFHSWGVIDWFYFELFMITVADWALEKYLGNPDSYRDLDEDQ